MDVMFVEAKHPVRIELPEILLEKLPREVTLFTTIQFIDNLDSMKTQLEKAGITTHIVKTRRTSRKGQILGCSTTTTLETDALYVGDGEFHPKALLIRNDKIIYTYDPKSLKQRVFTKDDVKTILKRLRGAYAKFLSSENIGIMVSTKYGQNKQRFTAYLKERFPDKKWYVFADNTFDFSSLQDFPFIDMYVNTSCERIGLDDMTSREIPIINAEDLIDLTDGRFDTV
ncbi:MAG: diphthamide synthesis protein [Nanobdellota archaeon]